MTISNKSQRVTFVTGKGGVGKSTVALAFAQELAKKKKNTLLIELGDTSYYQYVYNSPISYKPSQVMSNLSISLYSGQECLREYVLYILRIKKLADLFFDNKIMKTFINAAPALKELAILGKITSGIRSWGPEYSYDHIVVDGLSTGHFLALLRAPVGMSEILDVGPMGEQSRSIINVLKDSKYCDYKIVTLLEDLPVSETLELAKELKDIFNIGTEIICNKVYSSHIQKQDLQQILSSKSADASEDFSTFLYRLLSQQDTLIELLNSHQIKMHKVPFVFSVDGQKIAECIGKALHVD